jgi:hypothetical protein
MAFFQENGDATLTVMLPVVAICVAKMLPLKLLALNDATDVATFPTLYTFVTFQDDFYGRFISASVHNLLEGDTMVSIV